VGEVGEAVSRGSFSFDAPAGRSRSASSTIARPQFLGGHAVILSSEARPAMVRILGHRDASDFASSAKAAVMSRLVAAFWPSKREPPRVASGGGRRRARDRGWPDSPRETESSPSGRRKIREGPAASPGYALSNRAPKSPGRSNDELIRKTTFGVGKDYVASDIEPARGVKRE